MPVETNPQIEVIYILWRKAHKQVLEVPYMTHCDLLPLINDNMPLDCLLDCKYISFLKSILNSDNNVVNFTTKYKLFGQTSSLGKNGRRGAVFGPDARHFFGE